MLTSSDRPPPLDPRDPVSIGTWATWMSDRFIWVAEQLNHLHECLERKASDAEELSESRHQQNIASIDQVLANQRVFNSFIENATAQEVAKVAVQQERKRVADQASQRRAAIRSAAMRVAEIAIGAGVLSGVLHLIGL